MSQRQKEIQYLVILHSRKTKELTEIKKREQEIDCSRPTCSTSTSQLTEFDCCVLHACFSLVVRLRLVFSIRSKGGEHRSERNEITSSQLTDTGEFNKD